MSFCLGTAMLMAFALAAGAAQAAGETAVAWRDAATLTVEGRGWSDTDTFYHRLPARAKSIVTSSVWDLAGDSAGMVVRFVTDAPEIRARWKLTDANLAMNHMAATGVSGLDLYVRHNGRWRWLAVGRPAAQENEATLISGLPSGKREYALYLPLYNGVSKVEIGIPEGKTVDTAPVRTRAIKPVVFYGTSITQGGCASRPGMAYPAIIGRALDIPTVNLGFSGNGRCEHEVADLLADLDPSAYVIDPLPNMPAGTVAERIDYLLKALHAKHPNTPVLLVEHPIFTSAFNMEKGRLASRSWNEPLMDVYTANAPAWDGRLHYVKCDKLYGTDGEATVDGVHPTDVGFLRMAEVLEPIIEKALAQH